MSRWDNYPPSNQLPPQQPYADPSGQFQSTTTSNVRVLSGGTFFQSVDDGVNSDFVRCVYRAKNGIDTYNIMCDKSPGCCTGGCCPKDTMMMEGLYVLIAFVIVVAVVALLVGIICYSRSKSRQKKEDKVVTAYPYSQYGGSQVGMSGYHSPVYSTYLGPPSGRY